MVSSIVPTSTWAHNCGMHVMADYMIELIKQNDYQGVFQGEIYDKLLNKFSTIYQQDNLTWEDIKKATSEASPIDSQIIWGYVLRNMISEVFENNIEYKNQLKHHFLAALKLYQSGQLEELQSSYPVIYEACLDYFKDQALNNDNTEEQDSLYWEQL